MAWQTAPAAGAGGSAVPAPRPTASPTASSGWQSTPAPGYGGPTVGGTGGTWDPSGSRTPPGTLPSSSGGAGWDAPGGRTPPPMLPAGSGPTINGRSPSTTTPTTDPNNNLLTPGDQEKFYGATKSEYTDPSYTEKLVAQGMGGQLNDYYEFGQNKLNDQYAAMGGGPSGALLRASQGMRADQAHDMMDYTQAADQLHYGRLGAGEAAAGASDSGRTGRLQTAFGDATGLGNSESADAMGFYTNASNTSNPFVQSNINNGVQQSTINPGQSAFKDLLAGAGTFYKGTSGTH